MEKLNSWVEDERSEKTWSCLERSLLELSVPFRGAGILADKISQVPLASSFDRQFPPPQVSADSSRNPHQAVAKRAL